MNDDLCDGAVTCARRSFSDLTSIILPVGRRPAVVHTYGGTVRVVISAERAPVGTSRPRPRSTTHQGLPDVRRRNRSNNTVLPIHRVISRRTSFSAEAAAAAAAAVL